MINFKLNKESIKYALYFLLFTCFLEVGIAQTEPPSNLEGTELRTWLKANWYDGFHNDLGYNGARRAMYGYIDESSDGQVYGVYSGFNQTAAEVTFLNPINAEHTVPQSFFNQTLPMRSDIHHLYPTHMNVNSARGSDPFDEIVDTQTTKWYIGNTSLQTETSIPSSNIDGYSEDTSSKFEPKEVHKGDLARAIFYFYTMYENNGSLTRPIADVGDINVLYQWHLDDPPSAWEIQRNNRVEERQGNRNPYIDYPEALARAWGFEPVTSDQVVVSFERAMETIAPSSNYTVALVTDRQVASDFEIVVELESTVNIAYGFDGFETEPEASSGSLSLIMAANNTNGTFLIEFDPMAINSNLLKTIQFRLLESNDYVIGANNSFTLDMNGSVITALNEIEKESRVYPNPSKGFVYLEGPKENDLVGLYSINGRLIQEYKVIKGIDLTDLPKGFYLMMIRSEKSNQFHKLILE